MENLESNKEVSPYEYKTTPMDMFERAIAGGATPETLEKLLDLHERWEAKIARKEFDAAIAAAKAEISVIYKNKKITSATTAFAAKYADLATITKEITPALSKHGINYRFRTTQDDMIRVTCILSHNGGHFEENSLSASADISKGKNHIQALGSTLSYLQRYTLIQAVGLSTADGDDDGNSAYDMSPPISEEQVNYIIELINDTSTDEEKMCSHFKVKSVHEISEKMYPVVVRALEKKRSQK